MQTFGDAIATLIQSKIEIERLIALIEAELAKRAKERGTNG